MAYTAGETQVPDKICAFCGKPFNRRRNPCGILISVTTFNERRFCSQSCGAQSGRIQKTKFCKCAVKECRDPGRYSYRGLRLCAGHYGRFRCTGSPTTALAVPYAMGITRQKETAEELRTLGYQVRELEYQSFIDMTVNGYGVEVKTARRKTTQAANHHKSPRHTWRFCIHRHGELNEAGVSFYILCFESEAGKILRKLIVPAPCGKYILEYNPSSPKTGWLGSVPLRSWCGPC